MLTLHARLEQALSPRYADLAELASGGMGVVFRARDVTLDRPVAIKILVPELATAAGAARFRREAQILARLSHPNIVPVHAADEADGLFYYVMDLVEGETLGQRLEGGPLDKREVHQVARDLLSALSRVHREGVVHRDIKPDNIFLANGRAMLADFGVAQWESGSSASLTRTSDRPGTPSWMSPEQLRGGPVTPRTDLYALAMVLYEASTGRRWDSFETPDRADWSGVPWPLSRALQKALEPAAANRWSDAAAFAQALERPRALPWIVAGVVGVAGLLAVAELKDAFPSTAGEVPSGPRADLSLLPFEGGDSAALGRRLAQLVGNRMEWYPRWDMVPTPQSFAAWDQRRRGEHEPPDALAERAVGGALLRRGDAWILVLTVRADSGRGLVDEIEVPGHPSDQLGWSRAAAESLVVHLFPAEAPQFRELTGRSTRSLPAERELLAGNVAFQLDNLAEADSHYSRALQLDPGFAQAAWQRMVVARWRREVSDSSLRALLEEHGDQLPVMYRELSQAQLMPNLLERQAELGRLARTYADRGIVRYMAADELFHRGPLAGVPLDTGVELLAEVGRDRVNVDYASLHDEAAWGFIRLGREEDARREMDLRRERTTGSTDLQSANRAAFVQLAWEARFQPWKAALKTRWLLWRADSATTADLAQYLRVGLLFDVPRLQRSLARALEEHGPTDSVRLQGLIGGALARLMTGEWEDGLARMERAAETLRAPDMRLQLAEWRTLPEFLGLPRRGERERREALAVLAEVAEGGPLAARAAWSLALEALAREDTVEFGARHAQVHAAAPSGAGPARLDVLLHAYAAAARSRPDSALLLSSVLFETDSAGLLGGPFARAILYSGRAAWYTRLGQHREADHSLLWYGNSEFSGWMTGAPQAGEVDAVLGPAARLRRAASALQLGDSAAACGHVQRVRDLWRDADPGFKALLLPFKELRCA